MKKMMSKAAFAAMLSVAPISNVLYANTPPPAGVTNPVTVSEAQSWMDSFTGPFSEMYDWLTKQLTNDDADGVGYFVYDTLSDAYGSLLYFFNTILSDYGWSAITGPLGLGVVATDSNGDTYNYLAVFTRESATSRRDINWVEKDLNQAVPIPTRNVPVPIDGGASLLLAAGAAYGIKRFKKRKQA